MTPFTQNYYELQNLFLAVASRTLRQSSWPSKQLFVVPRSEYSLRHQSLLCAKQELC